MPKIEYHLHDMVSFKFEGRTHYGTITDIQEPIYFIYDMEYDRTYGVTYTEIIEREYPPSN